MPTIGRFSFIEPVEPAKGASPNVNMPPSAAAIQ
jgi:hypothetical protein